MSETPEKKNPETLGRHPGMIDSHVHLNHDDFKSDFDEVIARAREAGVSHMVNIGFDLPSSRETVGFIERMPFLYGAVGVHPHDATTYTDEVDAELAGMLTGERIIAVGEIGLDYYRDLSPRDAQRATFERQLSLARRLDKPVIIHCRDAFEDTIAELEAAGGSHRGIFHAFTGDVAMAERVLDLGFHIGIGGVVTFRNSGLADVVAVLPPESIVLETDCPYLTPAPYRGKRNEPAYVRYVVDKISEATGRTPDELKEMTNCNFAAAMGL